MLNQKTLVSLSFELDAVLWANRARFQPTNVLLHATASVLLLWLCVWMGLDTSVGSMCALLFATHPIHTEAVSLAPQTQSPRKVVCTSMCVINACLKYLTWVLFNFIIQRLKQSLGEMFFIEARC